MIQVIFCTINNILRFKINITGKIPADDNTQDFKIRMPLKYLSNIWRTLSLVLMNCYVNVILTWSENCVISFATGNLFLQ